MTSSSMTYAHSSAPCSSIGILVCHCQPRSLHRSDHAALHWAQWRSLESVTSSSSLVVAQRWSSKGCTDLHVVANGTDEIIRVTVRPLVGAVGPRFSWCRTMAGLMWPEYVGSSWILKVLMSLTGPHDPLTYIQSSIVYCHLARSPLMPQDTILWLIRSMPRCCQEYKYTLQSHIMSCCGEIQWTGDLNFSLWFFVWF